MNAPLSRKSLKLIAKRAKLSSPNHNRAKVAHSKSTWSRSLTNFSNHNTQVSKSLNSLYVIQQ